MKHLLITIVFFAFALLCKAQSFEWHPWVDLDGSDTTWKVVYNDWPTGIKYVPDSLDGYRIQSGELGHEFNVMGCKWSATMWSENGTNTIVFNLGGSNHIVAGKRKGFEGYPHDSLPYTFIAADHLQCDTIYDADEDECIVDSSYQFTIFGDFWPTKDAQWEFGGLTDTTGIFGIDFMFAK
jgi:hypothetical protein